MLRALALLPVVLAAAACGGGSTPATTTSATRGTLRVSITAESHHPQLGHTWTYRVRVTDAATGKPVAARIHLQFLFGGAPVGEVGRHRVRDGVWRETIPATGKDAFPPASVGQSLVLRANVTAPGYRPAAAGWSVKAVR